MGRNAPHHACPCRCQPAIPLADLRAACRVRNATLYKRLVALATAGNLVRSPDGFRVAGR